MINGVLAAMLSWTKGAEANKGQQNESSNPPLKGVGDHAKRGGGVSASENKPDR